MSINWKNVHRVLVVRLRSIGDTVLCTPSLAALREFLPEARIDILLEGWVAPLLDGFHLVDNVLRVGKSSGDRLRVARCVRRAKYDVVFNLHGGTTGTFFAAASGARHKVGFSYYQYRFLYSDVFPSGEKFWDDPRIHSVEQQLALLGSAGVPVHSRPETRLAVSDSALSSMEKRLNDSGLNSDPFVLMHPAAAFDTKEWPIENFARISEFLDQKGLRTVAVAAANEVELIERLVSASAIPVIGYTDLTLPEITGLASMAKLFVGNDSGIAHIAAAVGTPPVVIFGSSNIDTWRPWTKAPYEVVANTLPCQPCSGYSCSQFGEPRCIQEIPPHRVGTAIEAVLSEIEKRRAASPAVS